MVNSVRFHIKLICAIILLTILALTSCGVGASQESNETSGQSTSHQYQPETENEYYHATPAPETHLHVGQSTPQPANPLQQPLTTQDLLDLAYTRKQSIFIPSTERLTQLTYGRPPSTFALRFLSDFNLNPTTSEIFPTQDFIYDVQLYFDILREVYGAYTFFGGDEIFLPILDEILMELEEREYWYVTRVERMIHSKLSPYIQDNHLRIGFHTFSSEYSMFASNRFFDKTEHGFRDRTNGLYVQEVVGHNIDEVFRFTANQYGELSYTLVIVKSSDRIIENNLVIYKCGESENLRLQSIDNSARPIYREPSLEFINGFPVVTINAMYLTYFIDEHVEKANTFLSFVDKLRNEPAFIIDLRGNGGGSALLPSWWLYNLTGEVVPQNSLMLQPLEFYYAFQQEPPIPDSINYPPPRNDAWAQRVARPFGDNHVIISMSDPDRANTTVANDQIIIFLIGRHTASAAEVFIDMAFNVENTLVIGQNTQGTLLMNFCFPNRFLPYTGLSFGLGTTLFVHADAHNFREGVGFAPDIWVPHNEDALLAALALLRNHFDE